MSYRYRNPKEIPFAPEGQCPICGSHIFTKDERKAQVELTRKIVDELKKEKEVKKILADRLDNIEEEYYET